MLQGHSNSAREGISAQESSLYHDSVSIFLVFFFFFFFFPGLTLHQPSDFWATSQLVPLLLNELKIIITKNKSQHAVRTVTSSGRE